MYWIKLGSRYLNLMQVEGVRPADQLPDKGDLTIVFHEGSATVGGEDAVRLRAHLDELQHFTLSERQVRRPSIDDEVKGKRTERTFQDLSQN